MWLWPMQLQGLMQQLLQQQAAQRQHVQQRQQQVQQQEQAWARHHVGALAWRSGCLTCSTAAASNTARDHALCTASLFAGHNRLQQLKVESGSH